MTAPSSADSTVVLRAGRVVADWGRPRGNGDAIALRGGRVLATGPLASLWPLVGGDCPTYDLGDGVLAPSFMDAHLHLAKLALLRRQLAIDSDWTLRQVLGAVASAATPDSAAWIIGRGWDHREWGRWPLASDLESVAAGRKVALTRVDGHAMWLSLAAMRELGIDGDAADPPGGRIERDAGGGPTGVLLESAAEAAARALPQPSSSARQEALAAIWPELWREGITAVTDMGFDRLLLWDDLQALRREGRLGLRVALYVMQDGFEEARRRRAELDGGDDELRMAGLKLFLDGTLGSQTARLLEPYESEAAGAGLWTLTPEGAAEWTARAAAEGWPTAYHAIGDAAVRAALDACAPHGQGPHGRALRHRVEHIQLAHPADVARFARQGVTASIQPIHLADDWSVADRHWGSARCAERGYRWRDLAATGSNLALGSDAPIASANVLDALRVGLTRRDLLGRPSGGWMPGQELGLSEALRGYTRGPAEAVGWGASLGSLDAGRAADLVLFAADPSDASALLEGRARVRATMRGGRWVWSNGPELPQPG